MHRYHKAADIINEVRMCLTYVAKWLAFRTAWIPCLLPLPIYTEGVIRCVFRCHLDIHYAFLPHATA